MPPDDGRGLDDTDGVAPAVPDPLEQDPEEPISTTKPRPRDAALHDRQLLAKSEILESELGAAGEECADEVEDQHAAWDRRALQGQLNLVATWHVGHLIRP
jgi:hypothetical protein